MAIKWRLDSHLGTAKKALELGLNRSTASDTDLILSVFSKIIGSPIELVYWRKSDNTAAFSNYTDLNGKHAVFATKSLVGHKLEAYSIISECMACTAECESAHKDDYCNIIEQVYFEERDPKCFWAEYPQVQLERETDLGALEILFPTEERRKYAAAFCDGSLDTVELADKLGVPTAVLERALAEAYMKYCDDVAAQ